MKGALRAKHAMNEPVVILVDGPKKGRRITWAVELVRNTVLIKAENTVRRPKDKISYKRTPKNNKFFEDRHAKMAIRLIMEQSQPIDEYDEEAEDEDEEDRFVGICSQHYRMWRPECGSFALPQFQPQQYTDCDINDSTTKLDIASPELETRTISACCKATMGCEPTR